MENKNSNSNTIALSQNGKLTNGNNTNWKMQPTSEKSTGGNMQSSQLMKLFKEELKDIYWAENALTKAIPKMIKYATSPELLEALQNHYAETEEQIKRLNQVFEIIDKKVASKKCLAMEGLIKEAEQIMQECEKGAMCDAGIISAGQKIEHYEIATYGTLRQFAETLKLDDVVHLLDTTLSEEKAANDKLSEIAIFTINIDASHIQE